jgi:hypothetical protein
MQAFLYYVISLIDERKLSRSIHLMEAFDFKNSYLIRLENKIRDKYTCSQVDHFISEILKSIIKDFTEDGVLDLFFDNLIFNPDTFKYLCKALKENSNIRKLYIDGNSLGTNHEKINLLSDLLKNTTNIKDFCLKYNSLELDVKNIELLSNILKVNKTINLLDLNDNSIGLGTNHDQMKLICDVIKLNTTIKVLCLSDNSLGVDPRNIELLCDSLKENKTITK